MEETILNVKGMSCSHCVIAVKQAAGSISGVSEVNVDLEDGTVTITHSGEVSMNEVKKNIEDAGYDVVKS